jgi:predicted alpha/beta-fold hydrolase
LWRKWTVDIQSNFNPPLLLKNPTLQSALASSKIRLRGENPMAQASQDLILEVNGGVRLAAALSRQAEGKGKGLVILMHGWEGGQDSTYVLLTGRTLFRRGFDVLRLNFRDHGGTHHLNQGIFRAFLLEEVYLAVSEAAAWRPEQPVFVVGFSLGGNFALRVARECASRPIDNLLHVVGVSPLLDPDKATSAIDQHPLFRRYFLRKWRRSLQTKQALFPEYYDFEPAFAFKTVRSMTDALVGYLAPYKTAQEYFLSYTLAGDDLAGVRVPVTLVAAQDDPVIPFEDFKGLVMPPNMTLLAPRHGGHSGFVEGVGLDSWYQERIADIFNQTVMTAV